MQFLYPCLLIIATYPMEHYVELVFNHPLRSAFTYRIPPEWESIPLPGCRVQATFGHRLNQLGFVVRTEVQPSIDPERILPLATCLDDQPVLSEDLLHLLGWVSDYYFCSLGETLFAAFPFGSRQSVPVNKRFIPGVNFHAPESVLRITPQRQRVLDCFYKDSEKSVEYSTQDLQTLAGVSAGVINSMVEKGVLQIIFQAPSQPLSRAENLYRSDVPILNPAQTGAVERVKQGLLRQTYCNLLLHGITGSGKTEVFLFAIAEALRQGKTALVLVPEISLTPQTAARYRGRFPGQVEVLHSGLSQGRRFQAWNAIRKGEIPIVVGTRSAVFAPLENLGLIIVDEEHDSSYKQTDPAPRYHARDVAIYRAYLNKATVLLGSATPSLESYENVVRKKTELLVLPYRATSHPLPSVELVDMRYRSLSERILSHEARSAIEETLSMNLQSILFLNRRGHSTQLECRSCGKALECPDCSVTLVWHGSDQSLRCHHCGHIQPEPEKCPGCGSVWIRARGYGTEQVYDQVHELFPRARMERIDLDTTREEGAHDRILSSFRQGDIDILVGTQMISKGLDMPRVRLVVVIQAETALNVADFRAAERSFALLTQVAGRAGRGEHPGRVLVQSFAPNNYSIACALRHDYHCFRSRETRLRRGLLLPPYSRLVNIRAEDEDEQKVALVIQELVVEIKNLMEGYPPATTRLIGPTPCPIEKLQKRYRWQFLFATTRMSDRDNLLKNPVFQEVLQKASRKVKVTVDVDPFNLL
jgi:primosomal protein N' (replication factor Y)